MNDDNDQAEEEMTALAQTFSPRLNRDTAQGIVAAGASGLFTLFAVAPCVVTPHLLALPATVFVALMAFGWRRMRG